MKGVRWALVGTGILAAVLVMTSFALPARHVDRTIKVEGAPSQPVQQTIDSGGRKRTYWLYRPDGAPSSEKRPLEVVIFARGFPPPELATYTGLADREGLLLAFPVTNADWRVQSELDFVGDVIDDAVDKQNLDRDRVYVTGGSGAGFMAYRLACGPGGKRIAGVGALFAGIITKSEAPAGLAQACNPPRPVSIIGVHGTRDPFVPYTGRPCGNSESGNYVCLPSQVQLMAFWASVNGCDPTPTTTTNGTLKIELWRACRSSTTAVELATVDRGGHSSKSLTAGGVTPQARIWDFFKAHPGGQQSQATQLRALIYSVRVARSKGQRRIVVRLTINEPASVTISLRQGTKAVVSTIFRRPQGASTLTVAVPRRVKSGRYSLRLLVTAGSRAQVLTRSVSVPR